MFLGSTQAWTSRLVTLDERLLHRIGVLWPKCIALLPIQPIEDLITINLVALLCKDEVVRRICYWIEYQYEPFGTSPSGTKFSKGKIDIAVFLDRERDRYLAYECKRLNVTHCGVRSSLATRYVLDGMMRFMTEQYADGLPVGCMLGYVLDGDIQFALGQLNKAIEASKVALGLLSGPTTAPSLELIDRFLTDHMRSATNTTIELRHALLPF